MTHIAPLTHGTQFQPTQGGLINLFWLVFFILHNDYFFFFQNLILRFITPASNLKYEIIILNGSISFTIYTFTILICICINHFLFLLLRTRRVYFQSSILRFRYPLLSLKYLFFPFSQLSSLSVVKNVEVSLISNNHALDKTHWLHYCHCTKLKPSFKSPSSLIRLMCSRTGDLL